MPLYLCVRWFSSRSCNYKIKLKNYIPTEYCPSTQINNLCSQPEGRRIMAFAASQCPPHMITIWSFIQSSAPLRLYASIFFLDSFIYVNTMATTKTKRKRFSWRLNKVQKDFMTRILEGLKWSKDGNSRAPVVWKTWKMPESGKRS